MDQAQGMDGQESERSAPMMMAAPMGQPNSEASQASEPAQAQTQMQMQMHEAPQAAAGRDRAAPEDAMVEHQARSGDVSAIAVAAAATAQAAAPAAAVSAPQAPVPSMPSAEPFVLPLTDLSQLADQSGLIWVHSDTAKVAEVQSLIAAEPRALHVPRERPAPVQIDEGPLVLVETQRDWAEMRLPFEQETTRV